MAQDELDKRLHVRGEEANLQYHWYHLDHDQNWTASAGVSHKWANTEVYGDTLYGSGLYSGFANETELPSYETFNVGMNHTFKISPGNDLKMRLDVTNLTDLKYEILTGTGIGVFAPQYLPRRAIFVGLSKNF